jgi:hypothetical protein
MERMKLDPMSLEVESFEAPATEVEMTPTTTVHTNVRTCTCL